MEDQIGILCLDGLNLTQDRLSSMSRRRKIEDSINIKVTYKKADA